MRQIIGRLTEVLARLPLTDAGHAPTAGPPYDLDPEILQEGIPTSLVAQHLRILDELATTYTLIRASDEFQTGTDQPSYEATLRNLLTADDRLRQLFATENM
ncbi:hypothetical protein [Hymenobacter cellulosilyticus]|uniref:Uncharacterized protein n=1 Tax=Hymenobacter cellulosilyticus TaxID=2932248 RepID=A0A8T9QHN0_9BACT|nr:hypothetical protein [Hymenobacter cellulosilyticus]UOQ75109.1 hypothetical protein MUN79_28970 [Hymenobacter cellulosilyticus]